jgi:nucleoid-associated protein YgaU
VIRFTCPRCKTVMTWSDTAAGLKLSCPGCGQRVNRLSAALAMALALIWLINVSQGADKKDDRPGDVLVDETQEIVILKKNGTQVRGQLVVLTTEEVRYKQAENKTGLTYTAAGGFIRAIYLASGVYYAVNPKTGKFDRYDPLTNSFANKEALNKADADQLKSEANKAKMELDKSKAETERAKMEAEKTKAEAEKAKAEAEKAKAEADRAKQEAERAKAEPRPEKAAPPRANENTPTSADRQANTGAEPAENKQASPRPSDPAPNPNDQPGESWRTLLPFFAIWGGLLSMVAVLAYVAWAKWLARAGNILPGAWFYTHNGKQQYGPFTPTQLKQLAAAGQIRVGYMVRKGDAVDWVPAATVNGLFTPTTSNTSVPVPEMPFLNDGPARPASIIPNMPPLPVTPPPIPSRGALLLTELTESPGKSHHAVAIAVALFLGIGILALVVTRHDKVGTIGADASQRGAGEAPKGVPDKQKAAGGNRMHDQPGIATSMDQFLDGYEDLVKTWESKVATGKLSLDDLNDITKAEIDFVDRGERLKKSENMSARQLRRYTDLSFRLARVATKTHNLKIELP